MRINSRAAISREGEIQNADIWKTTARRASLFVILVIAIRIPVRFVAGFWGSVVVSALFVILVKAFFGVGIERRVILYLEICGE